MITCDKGSPGKYCGGPLAFVTLAPGGVCFAPNDNLRQRAPGSHLGGPLSFVTLDHGTLEENASPHVQSFKDNSP